LTTFLSEHYFIVDNTMVGKHVQPVIWDNLPVDS